MDQRLVQGNISYIALLPGQYLDIAQEGGQYPDIAREGGFQLPYSSVKASAGQYIALLPGQYLDIAREGGFQLPYSRYILRIQNFTKSASEVIFTI